MIKLYQLLVLLSLFSSAFAYALDGSWTLRTSEIPQLKKISAGIVFSFDSKLSVSQDQQISHILTIYACNKLTYSYSVQDDLIFFEYIQTGSQSRPCLSGQIVYLRSEIDIIFNFYIMGTMMLMLPPNGQPPIKFDRRVSQSLAQINGVWNIQDAIFYSKVTEPNVTINGSHISFCGGKTLFSYRLAKDNGITISSVNSISCNNQTLPKLANASLYRVNEASDPNILYIYDKNVSIIMQLSQQAPYPIVKAIQVGNSTTTSLDKGSSASNLTKSSNSTVNQTTDKNSISLSNKTNVTNPVDKNAANATIPKSPGNVTAPVNNPEPVNNKSAPSPANNANNPQNITTTAIGNTSNDTKKPTTLNTANSTANASTSTQNKTSNQSSTPITSNSSATAGNTTNSNKSTTSNASANVNSSNNNSISAPSANPISKDITTTSSAQNMVSVTSASQIFGIWYPYNFSQIPSLSSYPAGTFSKYQIIINSARILISGGCNTIFSTYSFTENKFTNFKTVSTKNNCSNNYDSVIADVLYGNNQFYTIGSSPPILAVKSANSTLLMLLSQTAPQ